MPRFSFTRHVAAPPEQVFAIASDIPNAPRMIRGISRVEMLTPGPVGAGTRFRESRKFMGREATETMEVTRFDPPRSYSVECESHGCRYDSTFTFTPDGGGTRVDLTFDATPVSFLARIFSPLASLMSGTIRKCIGQDLDDLCAAAESREPSPAA